MKRKGCSLPNFLLSSGAASIFYRSSHCNFGQFWWFLACWFWVWCSFSFNSVKHCISQFFILHSHSSLNRTHSFFLLHSFLLLSLFLSRFSSYILFNCIFILLSRFSRSFSFSHSAFSHSVSFIFILSQSFSCHSHGITSLIPFIRFILFSFILFILLSFILFLIHSFSNHSFPHSFPHSFSLESFHSPSFFLRSAEWLQVKIFSSFILLNSTHRRWLMTRPGV